MAFLLPDDPMSDVESPSVGVTIVNKQHFQTTAWLWFSWRLLADGIPLLVGDGDHKPSADGWVPLEPEDFDMTIPPQVPRQEQSETP